MRRRQFCLQSGLLLAHGILARAGQQVAGRPPWFDSRYSTLPTLAEQQAGLSSTASEANSTPRMISDIPVTGLPADVLDEDEQIVRQVQQSGLVGVCCAIAIDGELAFARGYGFLSSHDRQLARPTSPGYIGSVTKPLCAMTALTLARDGKLDLDAKVLEILPLEPLLKPGEQRQPELDSVTVRMLMNHTSGLFNVVERLFDGPYYRKLAQAGQLQLIHGDPSQYDLVRRGMAVPFVSQPGVEAHYSGQGLQVLGRTIEKLSGKRLDRCMGEGLLEPCGVKHHATLSYLTPVCRRAINAGRASESASLIPSPFSDSAKRCVSWNHRGLSDECYGNHWGQADACGSSMLSALDLLRFVCRFPEVIGFELFTEAMTVPQVRNQTFHGLGWGVSKHGSKFQFGHSGAIPGARCYCESTFDGIQYAVLVAGDRGPAFDRINRTVVELGRSLRASGRRPVGWETYGFLTN